MKDIFIIIVTYNGKKWIHKCLKTTKPFPVIVVDNDSQDGTVELIKSHFPEVVLFEQKENLGFGRANNTGISYALKKGAEYIFLLNQDAYLQENCIRRLIEVQKKNPDYGILSPIHLNGLGDRLDRNFANYIGFNANADFYSDYILKKALSEVYTVPFVNAAGWLISRKCLEIIGGFDPIFFHYGEDDNYCQRVKYHGLKIGVVPETFLRHDRENKKLEQIKPRSIQFLQKKQRGFKILYGDINKEFTNGLEKEKKELKQAIIKSLLSLKIELVQFLKIELNMIKELKFQINKSREKNKIRGKNYLD